jgi:2-iminobutanoate/2-iminopropanoate deaminase
MEKQSRRRLLTSAAKAAVAGGGAMMAGSNSAFAQKAAPKPVDALQKRAPLAKPVTATTKKPPLVSSAVAYGNLLFLAGIGAHFQGTVEEHTKFILEQMEKNLIASGSSMQKVIKIGVFLSDLKDYDKMNSVYAQQNWGDIPPVRTTIAPSAGIPGNSLVEMDCVAYI